MIFLMMAFVVCMIIVRPQGMFVTYLVFGIGIAFISPCIGYLVIALRTRCPHCGFKFLKNPKAFGPANFQYHPDCSRGLGINPWGYQIMRLLRTRRIKCINCGREIFE